MVITSTSNSIIKMIRSLNTKKGRILTGLYIAEGLKMVEEAINSKQIVEYIVKTESFNFDCELPNIITVSENVFNSISDTITPQGILAVIKQPTQKTAKNSGNCLLLDGVSDTGNIGGIIRTAAATNYLDIFIKNTCDPFSPKAVRASMGGIFKVNLIEIAHSNIKELINKPIIVSDTIGENIFDFKLNGSHCLVIGSESLGVSKEIKSIASYTVSIPMENGVESLNAAVAAGVMMYSINRCN